MKLQLKEIVTKIFDKPSPCSSEAFHGMQVKKKKFNVNEINMKFTAPLKLIIWMTCMFSFTVQLNSVPKQQPLSCKTWLGVFVDFFFFFK